MPTSRRRCGFEWASGPDMARQGMSLPKMDDGLVVPSFGLCELRGKMRGPSPSTPHFTRSPTWRHIHASISAGWTLLDLQWKSLKARQCLRRALLLDEFSSKTQHGPSLLAQLLGNVWVFCCFGNHVRSKKALFRQCNAVDSLRIFPDIQGLGHLTGSFRVTASH